MLIGISNLEEIWIC